MAQLPLARQTGLITKEIPNEVLVYDSDRDSALCLNRTMAFVWKHCDGKTPPAQIARLIERELRITDGDEVVSLALKRLDKSHLLTGKAVLPVRGISRRELVKRLGATATLPIIASIMVGPAGQQGSCTPVEGSCMISTTCCSNCCSKGGTCLPPSSCMKQ